MSFAARLGAELEQFKQDGVYKRLNYLEAPQGARTNMQGRGNVVILSSNNYLGLCNEPEVVAAGKRALDQFGAGTGSVRFICGTFTIHRELEQALARFVGCESSLTYVSCWNANEGLVATLLGEQDIVISDQLNHASIIDAIRLAIRDKYRVATTVGYGPRYLHSTGQLHKGGPNTGVFLQLVGDDPDDLPIPGEKFTFGVLKQAQALGDFQALRNHGRRVLRVQARDVAQGLARIGQSIGAPVNVG